MIELYPKIENVLADTSLKCYFRPLLTYKHTVDRKEYQIHLLGTDGLFCEEKFKNAESNFFGFDYNGGKYIFSGNIECFAECDKIPIVYDFLCQDFQNKKENYLSNKVTTEIYLKGIRAKLKKLAIFEDFNNITYYAEAFYCYEFTKYYYEKTGKHKHISVVTEDYGENEDDFLLDKAFALNVLEEFFVNLKWNLENDYGITKDMFCCAVERYRFMSICGGGVVFTLLDKNADKVYVLEYHS